MAEIEKIQVGSTYYDLRDTSKTPLTAWTAIVTTQTWSRICYIECGRSTVGGNFLISIAATRGSVVYDDLIAVEFNHQAVGHASIMKIVGGNYSSYKFRVVVANSGNGVYVELYDNADSVSTTQSVYCTVVSSFIGAITTYSSYTAGSIPSSYYATELASNSSYNTQIAGNLKVEGTVAATAVYQNGTQVQNKATVSSTSLIL